MIKNIYDKKNKYYIHEYYCDNCFRRIYYGEILRSNFAVINLDKFDLCVECKIHYDEWEMETEK